jgi:hypothetical protein
MFHTRYIRSAPLSQPQSSSPKFEWQKKEQELKSFRPAFSQEKDSLCGLPLIGSCSGLHMLNTMMQKSNNQDNWHWPPVWKYKEVARECGELDALNLLDKKKFEIKRESNSVWEGYSRVLQEFKAIEKETLELSTQKAADIISKRGLCSEEDIIRVRRSHISEGNKNDRRNRTVDLQDHYCNLVSQIEHGENKAREILRGYFDVCRQLQQKLDELKKQNKKIISRQKRDKEEKLQLEAERAQETDKLQIQMSKTQLDKRSNLHQNSVPRSSSAHHYRPRSERTWQPSNDPQQALINTSIKSVHCVNFNCMNCKCEIIKASTIYRIYNNAMWVHAREKPASCNISDKEEWNVHKQDSSYKLFCASCNTWLGHYYPKTGRAKFFYIDNYRGGKQLMYLTPISGHTIQTALAQHTPLMALEKKDEGYATIDDVRPISKTHQARYYKTKTEERILEQAQLPKTTANLREARNTLSSTILRNMDQKAELERKEKEKLQDELEELKLCSVCLDEPKGITLGCGHAFCATCAHQVSDCPVCREPITSRVKLFL